MSKKLLVVVLFGCSTALMAQLPGLGQRLLITTVPQLNSVSHVLRVDQLSIPPSGPVYYLSFDYEVEDPVNHFVHVYRIFFKTTNEELRNRYFYGLLKAEKEIVDVYGSAVAVNPSDPGTPYILKNLTIILPPHF